MELSYEPTAARETKASRRPHFAKAILGTSPQNGNLARRPECRSVPKNRRSGEARAFTYKDGFSADIESIPLSGRKSDAVETSGEQRIFCGEKLSFDGG